MEVLCLWKSGKRNHKKTKGSFYFIFAEFDSLWKTLTLQKCFHKMINIIFCFIIKTTWLVLDWCLYTSAIHYYYLLLLLLLLLLFVEISFCFGIVAIICIGWEVQCFPYAGFFFYGSCGPYDFQSIGPLGRCFLQVDLSVRVCVCLFVRSLLRLSPTTCRGPPSSSRNHHQQLWIQIEDAKELTYQ